ncbi:MAG: diacylglycerol kinase family lipid kinase [Bdellovibrionales bacterium]|nr:diacylglycerol kinase family lipid kinase [Bdellovibrionales bacterium]
MYRQSIRRFGIIYNQRAGGGRVRPIRKMRHYDRFIRRLKKAKIENLVYQIKTTEYHQHAKDIGKHMYYDGIRDFIVIGGDGTLHEAINGIMEAMRKEPGGKVKIGIVPRGTGNSFLRDLDYNEDRLLEAIAENRWRACDTIQLRLSWGYLYSINLVSLGFVADVAKLRNDSFSLLGNFGYTLAVLVKLFTLSPYRFQCVIDGRSFDQDLTFLSINNSRYTGGDMLMAPHARFDDGKFDLIEVEPISKWKLLRAFPKIFTGKHQFLPEVKMSQATCIDFPSPLETHLMIDGEVEDVTLEQIKILPESMYVYQ